MLQNAPIEMIGASHKRVRWDAEHDVHLSVVDFNAADQCADIIADGRMIDRQVVVVVRQHGNHRPAQSLLDGSDVHERFNP